jgi:hypothetical protein
MLVGCNRNANVAANNNANNANGMTLPRARYARGV